MGRPSKLSEEQWETLFDLDRAGVRRAVLAERFGIGVGTICWQARRRGRMKTQDPLAVDHRKRPPEGWPEDHVFCQSHSGMTPARWRGLVERRNAGETDEALAEEFGVSVGRIADVASELGMRKCETPGAVFRPRGPGVGTGDYRRRIEVVKIEMDWKKPAGSVHDYDLKIVETLNAGDEVEASRMWKWRGRMGQMGGVTRAEIRQVISPSPFGGGWSQRSGDRVGAARLNGDGPCVDRLALPTPSLRDDPPQGEGEASGLVLRPEQQPPEGAWATWLFLGGRGAGKTLAGASWIADQAESVGRLALIGPTLHDAREVMIGGPSGILALPRWRERGAWPVYEPSRRRLRFPSGAEAWVFSAEDPESLRGPQFGAAWADEFCAWRGGEGTLALLRMGLRLRGGDGAPPPRLMVSTTPKPTRALKGLMAEGSCVVSRAATVDNAANLAPGFVEGLEALYGGTRRAAQELEGRVVEIEGALFTSTMMTDCRTDEGFKPWGRLGPRSSSSATRDSSSGMCEGGGVFERVVVGVDPTTTVGGDACGIVVVGRRRRADGRSEAVVLADRSARGLSPEGWARRARTAAEAWGAEAIVVEVNQGGEMVRAVFRAVGCETPIREVRAAEGKRARAEPVAALYEQGRVLHAGDFGDLEEELMAVGGEDDGRWSLDRADALVWAVTALIVKEAAPPKVWML
ncbi:terminase large subunit domain-containing protein [Brevundimonas staleyi]|uniref:Terminase large subunit domain-containing protein n=1 Tax=Brevundimonas staleyi TaxID=74326 RepID=A0ABW0FU07_9CAUL